MECMKNKKQNKKQNRTKLITTIFEEARSFANLIKESVRRKQRQMTFSLMDECNLWLAAWDQCYYVRLIAGGYAAPRTRIILSSPPATCSPRFSSHLMSPVQPWVFQQGQPDTSAPKLNVKLQIGRVQVEKWKVGKQSFSSHAIGQWGKCLAFECGKQEQNQTYFIMFKL